MIKLKEGDQKSEVKGYTIVRLLGEGNNARVFQVIKEGQKQSAAAKFLSRAVLDKDPRLCKLANSEGKILKSIKNENVVRYIDHFLTKQSVVIVMEYCEGGELQTYIDKKGRLTEYQATIFLKQILNGFKGLHEANVMHRDFKASNVMFSNGILKIVDLGYSKMLKEQDITRTILGTALTMAPQLHKQKSYNWKADIWSVGVVFYQMIYGEYPYYGHSNDSILKKIKSQRPNYSKVMNISDKAKDLVERCLTVDPDQRITWKEIYAHPILEEQKIPFQLKSSLRLRENKKFYDRQFLQNVMKQEKQKQLSEQLEKEQWTEGYEQTIEQSKMKELQAEHLQMSQRQLAIKEYQRSYLSRRNSIMFIFKEIAPCILRIHNQKVVANHIITLYIICKKAYHNLIVLVQQLTHGQNILAKSQYFQEFLASKQLKELKDQVETDCLLIVIQAEQLKNILPENLNEATRRQLDFQIIANPIWSAFVQQIVQGYENELIAALDNNSFKEPKLKREVIRLIQGLHYYRLKGSDADVEYFDKYTESLSYEQAELRMRERQLNYLKDFQK